MGFPAAWLERIEAAGLLAESVEPGPPLDILETPFQNRVIDLAKRHGFICYHTHNSRRSAKGYPDVAFAKVGAPFRYFLAELKRETEKPSPEQLVWINAIRAAGIDCYLWRPSDWPFIVQTLSAS